MPATAAKPKTKSPSKRKPRTPAKPRTERQSQAELMRAKRLLSRIVVIPALSTADRKLRDSLEADVFAWLRHFGHEEFTRDFTDQQREMIAAIERALSEGADQAVAASRGEGKTTIAEWVLLFHILRGSIDFAVLFSATGGAAEQSLKSIRERIEDNERLQQLYPEVCSPVTALENTPQRAFFQQVAGHRHDNGEPFEATPAKYSWCGNELRLPKVPGSPSSQAIIATRGLDAEVRGMKRGQRRPKLAIIDDPDTDDSVGNPLQAEKLEKRIDRNIAGLAGQQQRIARVMLTTIQRRGTVSHRFTDPKLKPSWNGRRFKFLVSPPTRRDLWDEYVTLRQADWQAGTTAAHDMYVANREAMDAGAVVANPDRRGDGTELSALQFYFNEVARIGPEAVATEFDNDPPEETAPPEITLTPHRIQRQLSGFERCILPPNYSVITQGIDVRKEGLNWVVRAWDADASGYTIDYGFHEIHGLAYGSDEGVELAVKRAIVQRMEATAAYPFHVDLTLVDAGWKDDAVYAACLEVGEFIMPVMGYGRSAGCVRNVTFHDIDKATPDKKPGDGYFLKRKSSKLSLVIADADKWKQWEHARWMTDPEQVGSMTIFGRPEDRDPRHPDRLTQTEKDHHAYARHITNERLVEEIYRGVKRTRWRAKNDNVHWLDASYYSDVAAAMKGISLYGGNRNQPILPAAVVGKAAIKQPMTFAEMRRRARGGR